MNPIIEGNKEKYKKTDPAPVEPPESARLAHMPVQMIPGMDETNPIIPKIIGVLDVLISVII